MSGTEIAYAASNMQAEAEAEEEEREGGRRRRVGGIAWRRRRGRWMIRSTLGMRAYVPTRALCGVRYCHTVAYCWATQHARRRALLRRYEREGMLAKEGEREEEREEDGEGEGEGEGEGGMWLERGKEGGTEYGRPLGVWPTTLVCALDPRP
eukprot:3498148-Rhodomonas_salina.1